MLYASKLYFNKLSAVTLSKKKKTALSLKRNS